MILNGRRPRRRCTEKQNEDLSATNTAERIKIMLAHLRDARRKQQTQFPTREVRDLVAAIDLTQGLQTPGCMSPMGAYKRKSPDQKGAEGHGVGKAAEKMYPVEPAAQESGCLSTSLLPVLQPASWPDLTCMEESLTESPPQTAKRRLTKMSSDTSCVSVTSICSTPQHQIEQPQAGPTTVPLVPPLALHPTVATSDEEADQIEATERFRRVAFGRLSKKPAARQIQKPSSAMQETDRVEGMPSDLPAEPLEVAAPDHQGDDKNKNLGMRKTQSYTRMRYRKTGAIAIRQVSGNKKQLGQWLPHRFHITAETLEEIADVAIKELLDGRLQEDQVRDFMGRKVAEAQQASTNCAHAR